MRAFGRCLPSSRKLCARWVLGISVCGCCFFLCCLPVPQDVQARETVILNTEQKQKQRHTVPACEVLLREQKQRTDPPMRRPPLPRRRRALPPPSPLPEVSSAACYTKTSPPGPSIISFPFPSSSNTRGKPSIGSSTAPSSNAVLGEKRRQQVPGSLCFCWSVREN